MGLRKISEPVEKLTNEELKLIKDLEDTMYEANGIGLAAIQVGIPKRIVVIDVSKDAKIKKPYYFINPVIKSFSNETSVYEEGCLSIPETFIEIERPKKVLVEYIDIDGLFVSTGVTDIADDVKFQIQALIYVIH